MEERVARIETRLDGIDKRLDRVEANQVELRKFVETKFDQLNVLLQEIQSGLGDLKVKGLLVAGSILASVFGVMGHALHWF